MNDVNIELLSRLVIGVTFALSARGHLASMRGFKMVVLNYRVLHGTAARVYASVLPFAEAAVACALILGVLVNITVYVVLALLLSFAVAVLAALRGGRQIRCGCFGTRSRETLGRFVLLRILMLAGFAMALLAQPTVTAQQPQSSDMAAVFLAAFILLIGFLAPHIGTILTAFKPLELHAPYEHSGRGLQGVREVSE